MESFSPRVELASQTRGEGTVNPYHNRSDEPHPNPNPYPPCLTRIPLTSLTRQWDFPSDATGGMIIPRNPSPILTPVVLSYDNLLSGCARNLFFTFSGGNARTIASTPSPGSGRAVTIRRVLRYVMLLGPMLHGAMPPCPPPALSCYHLTSVLHLPSHPSESTADE